MEVKSGWDKSEAILEQQDGKWYWVARAKMNCFPWKYLSIRGPADIKTSAQVEHELAVHVQSGQ